MATASDGSIYVFGGYEDGQGKSNDLFKLDVATGEWHLIEPLEHFGRVRETNTR